MVRLASLAAALTLVAVPAWSRGLFPTEPPLQRPAFADTSLVLEIGATAASGDTSAFLLDAALAPVRRGPLRLGFTWNFVSVHTSDGRQFGFGDPKAYARLRLFGTPREGVALFAEGWARIPIAEPNLYPFASGGQEIEFAGTLGIGRDQMLSCGYIWSEPPAGDQLGTSQVPHSLHAAAAFATRFASWFVRVRGDAYWMEGGREQGRAEASFGRLAAHAINPTIAAGVAIGAPDERIGDAFIALRFATRLR
jgi:hypothetical protein